MKKSKSIFYDGDEFDIGAMTTAELGTLAHTVHLADVRARKVHDKLYTAAYNWKLSLQHCSEVMEALDKEIMGRARRGRL